MRNTRQGICLWAVMLFALANVAHAQSTTVTPEDEYKKLIRVSEDIQPLGESPFGEQVSLYNGSLSFEQTDVSLAGNGPLLQVSRSFRPVDRKESGTVDGAFSDWDIEIPRITSLAATHWLVAGASPRSRCSQFGPPPTVAGKNGGADWVATSWWNGYQLVVPGQGSQDLLKRSVQNTLSPTMGSTAFPIVTTRHWMITCGVATDDPVGDPGGEGFKAVAPDGTLYWFTHLAYRWAPTMHRPIGSGPLGLQSIGVQPNAFIDDYLTRRQAMLLVTRIEDRFGNSLTYSYSGAQLSAITASDGRQVTLDYLTGTGRIGTISVTPATGPARTWSYQYSATATPLLTQVTLPDGSAWAYNLAGFRSGEIIEESQGDCDTLGLVSSNVLSGSIVHPSGLTGTFHIQPVVRGRSYVPRQCVVTAIGEVSSYAYNPRSYAGFAIVQKNFSGAGLPSRTWSYSYSPANASWSQDCAGGCASTVWTDVVDPDGHAVRSTFSNRFDETEGQLQRTDYYSGAVGTSLLRSEASRYAASTTGAWPSVYGYNLQSRMNLDIVQQVAPLDQRTITQDGNTFTWQATAFNAFAQVTQTARSNNVGQPTLTESTSYLNDLPHWVLGLPTQTKTLTYNNITTNEVVDEYQYDTTDVTLQWRKHFGQTLMNYTFNSAGQLASFTDGNSHTTTLGNYKRGIPRAIGYPDGTSQSLAVDDFGQITSITDQAGSTTSYSYDPVGRVTHITYPSGDEQAWYPSVFSYDYVTAAERGIGAGHWRRIVSKGSARAVTYFDAMLRPVLSDSYIDGVAGSNTSTLTNYDSKGQKTFTSYPSEDGSVFNFTTAPGTAGIKGSTSSYDALGRLVQVQQDSELGVLTASTAYLSGARQQVTDPKGNVTTTSYQVFDQPSYDAVIKVQAPAGATQTIARDPYGHPTEIHQYGSFNGLSGDLTKKLVYDSYYRLCRTSEPESGSEVMGYDGANNLAWSVSGATLSDDGSCHPELAQSVGVTMRSYDAMNRLWKLTPPAGTQGTVYTYDALGNVASAVSGISTWTASRNKRGMLTSESLQLSGQSTWAIGYAHDVYGSVRQVQYPDGESIDYAPDALGRATQVGSYASGITYFPNGAVSSFAYANGLNYVAEQNTRQQLRNLSYGEGGTLDFSEDLTYDANGNITQVDDLTAGGPRNKTFGYDALNRLTSAQATGLWGTESYTYDPLNNLRTRVSGGQTLTYNYNPLNQLASISGGAGSTFAYDNRGNVIDKNGASLVFDQKNQLTQIPGYGSYAYDAAGRRVKKTSAAGASTYYFYNQAGQLLYQVDGVTGKTTNLIYLGRKLVARNVTTPPQIPATPTLSVPTTSASGSYTVSWSSVSGATSYALQEQANGGSSSTQQSSGAVSWAASGKGNGSYGYRVQACSADGCSAWSPTHSVTVLLPPITPSSISVPATSTGSIAVSWAASATTTSYTLQQRLGAGSWGGVYSGAATSSTRTVTASGSYTYQVQACNASGCSAYKVSGAVAVTIPPASAPTLSVPASSGSGSYTVSWGGVSGATSYTVQEQVNGGSWATIQTSGATSKAIGGKGNGTYGYRVQACNVGGCGPWSGTGSITVTLIPATPGAPSLSITGPSYKPVVHASWTAVTGATSYQLEETHPQDGVIIINNGSATSWQELIYASGTVKFRVKACSSAGCSAFGAYGSIMLHSGLDAPLKEPVETDTEDERATP